MHQKQQEVQRKITEENKVDEQQPWKMKRFASVESKLGQAVVGGGGPRGAASGNPEPITVNASNAAQPQRKMTKAEQMKLRMSQERNNGSAP